MQNVREKIAWAIAGVLALFVVAAVAGVVSGGPLDPPGAPSATMKTLADVPGSWNRLLSSAGADPCNTARFTCVFSSQAVLDNETGLVWQREAGTSLATFASANDYCLNLLTVNRKGWRLPTSSELSSLVDVAGITVKLPAGHPFTSTDTIGTDPHWTSTDDPVVDTSTTNVMFSSGSLAAWPKAGTAPALERALCVRAGETS